MGMLVEVKDPDQKIIMSRAYGAEGKFTFTSHTPGEHTMCLSTNSSRWFGGSSLVSSSVKTGAVFSLDWHDRFCGLFQRVHLDISIGEHANDYKEIAARDKLSELQLRVRQLLDQVDQITKEQNYQRVSD